MCARCATSMPTTVKPTSASMKTATYASATPRCFLLSRFIIPPRRDNDIPMERWVILRALSAFIFEDHGSIYGEGSTSGDNVEQHHERHVMHRDRNGWYGVGTDTITALNHVNL